MRKYKTLVTGIGTIIGYGVINSLRASEYVIQIVGMDMNSDAIGKIWCDEFITALPASDDNYIDFLIDTIQTNQIDIVYIGTEQEMKKISASRKQLGTFLDRIVINKKEIIDLTDDKWETYKFLIKHNLPAIESYITGDFAELKLKLGDKFLLKPRQSYSSRGIVRVFEERSFNFYKQQLADQFMAQKIVGDDESEYTAAVFGYGDGKSTIPIIMRRKLSFEGSTNEAYIVKGDNIENDIKKLVEILKPIGPTNFQYRKERNINYLLEINPRISSSTSLRTAFGFNEAEIGIRCFINGERVEDIMIKEGKAKRYISDYVEFI